MPGPSAIQRLLLTFGGILVAWTLRLLGATWRASIHPQDLFARGEPFVGALWHRGLFVAAYAFRGRGVVVPVSRSRDGDRIAEVLKRLGFGPSPRGSSSRGAARLLATLIRAARQGSTIGILCDGPRGPAGQLKPGVLAVSRASGVAVRPVGIAASPCLRFRSWDRVALPLPFARVACVIGPPLQIPRDAGREALEAYRIQLQAEIDRQQDGARTMLAGARKSSPTEFGA